MSASFENNKKRKNSNMHRKQKNDDNRRFFDRQQNESEKESVDRLRADRLEGKNPVLEAFISGRTVNKLWVLASDGKKKDMTIQKILSLAKKQKTPVIEMSRAALDKMAVTHAHQGVIAQTASHEYVDIQVILDQAEEKNEPPFILMVDGLKDAYNLGSILRIADAAGVHGVIIPRHRSVGLDAMVAKASAGAIEHVPVSRVNNLSQTILSLREKGFWVLGADVQSELTYDQADYKGPIIIVIGSEGEGISKAVIEKCDFIVSIPMKGQVNSLNAAVATGIVVFEASKARHAERQ